MIGALLYLDLRSRANALRARVQRLRQPRYAFGAVVGLAYLWFFFFRPMFGTRPGNNKIASTLGWLWSGDNNALLLLLYVAAGWFIGGARAKLAFTEAEVAWLFPAPVARRTLVHFKLLQSQISLTMTALVFAALAAAAGGSGAFAARFAGWWTVLTFINLHGVAGGFTRERLVEFGLDPQRRRLVLGVALAGIFGATAWWTKENYTGPAVLELTLETLPGFLVAALQTPPLTWLLEPFRWLVAPFRATGGAEFLRAFAPALVVIVAHYAWAMAAIVGFEEASVAAAEKRSAVLQAARSGKSLRVDAKLTARPAPFALATVGRAEIAWLWQRLIAAGPWFFPRRLGAILAITAAVAWWFRSTDASRETLGIVGIVAAALGAYVLLLSPALVRRTWVQLFERLEVIKSYPVRGWQVVLGELLTPVVLLTAAEMILFTVAAILVPGAGPKVPVTAPDAVAAWVALLLMIPPLAGMMFGAQLSAALLLPAWFRPGTVASGGFEVIGQRLIFSFGFLVVLLVAIAPAAAFAVGAILLAGWLGAPPFVAILATGIVAGALLVTEFAALLWWLGRRFEKLDLATDLPR